MLRLVKNCLRQKADRKHNWIYDTFKYISVDGVWLMMFGQWWILYQCYPLFQWFSQQTFTCSKSTVEILAESVKYVQECSVCSTITTPEPCLL